MSVAVALEVLKLSRDTWSKIPKQDRKKILEAVKEKNFIKAGRIAAKYHSKFKNPCPKPIHCSLCGKGISGTTGKPFKVRMAKLRSHRKRSHPKAHKKSVHKGAKARSESE